MEEERRTNLQIKFLQAGKGDAILISYQGDSDQYRHILIDAGVKYEYKYKLRKELEGLYAREECLDLVVITHQDDDHLNGFKELLIDLRNGEFGGTGNFIKKYWFNAIGTLTETDNHVSAGSGAQIETFMANFGLQNRGKDILEGEIMELDGAKITVLSPTKEHRDAWLKKNELEWTKALGEEIAAGEQNDYSELIEVLKDKNHATDDEENNGASIAFLLEYKSFVGLFLGDAFPRVVAESLKKHKGCSPENPLKVDVMKLSHHGGIKNFTDELLSIVSVSDFVISTKTCPPKPSKATIAKIVSAESYDQRSRFLFNYPRENYQELWSQGDFRPEDYNFRFAESLDRGFTWTN